MSGLTQQFESSRRKARISLTPLIDVVFILLVFFMLASNFDQKRAVELTTPQTGKGVSSSSVDPVLTVIVEGGQKYSSEGQSFNDTEIRTLLKQNVDGVVVVRASDSAQVQDMIMFLDMTAQLGITRLRLADIGNE